MGNAPRKLSEEDLRSALDSLGAWRIEAGKLHRTWQFADFVEAWGFMSEAALIVQQMDHHPEWSNVYRTVVVDLVTHDAGGITARDVELARRLEAQAARRPANR
jgi:4a-hydroxytetrahydrobiopterin dehydratase